MGASDWDKVLPPALAHANDATVISRLAAAERDVTAASRRAFDAHRDATPRRRAALRAKLDTACEVRDMWLRVAVARGLQTPVTDG